MTQQSASRSPTSLQTIFALFDMRRASWGVVSAPILHGGHGSSGSWGEILIFGLMVSLVVVLATLALRGGRRRGKRRDE
jgi:hypothetical protein